MPLDQEVGGSSPPRLTRIDHTRAVSASAALRVSWRAPSPRAPRERSVRLERVTGIEPALSAWEADERVSRDLGERPLSSDFGGLGLTVLHHETPFVTALSGTDLARDSAPIDPPRSITLLAASGSGLSGFDRIEDCLHCLLACWVVWGERAGVFTEDDLLVAGVGDYDEFGVVSLGLQLSGGLFSFSLHSTK